MEPRHLECSNSVWSPYKFDQIETLEKMQTQLLKWYHLVADYPIPIDLRYLNIPTLRYRIYRGNMIETYKILNGIYDNSFSLFASLSVFYYKRKQFQISQALWSI